MVMLDEKIDKTVIDAAAKKFGMPMGPIELADQVGLDICLDVGDMLRSKFGDALPPTPAWLREKVAKGELGRKTGKGFYVWKDGKADTSSAAPSHRTEPSAEMIDRLMLPMSNVCVACLREGIVDNADVVDGAMIFGTGYAPFRGGPLNYARTRGVGQRRLHLARAGAKNSATVLRPMPAGRISSDRDPVHAPPNDETEPRGDLCTRTLAMPADTNANGDIFGGWLLSQMDIGGGVFASKIAKSRTVTVAIDAMNFRKAVYVGDLVSVHANLVRVGRTSITVHLEAWVLRRKDMQSILVTDGNFTYVSIDEQGHPQAIQRDGAPIAT